MGASSIDGQSGGGTAVLQRAASEKALGPDHPDTATSLNNLGYLLQAMGNLAEARPYYQRALAIVEKSLGANHPNTKIVRGNLSSLDG
ncbi:MAG: tetratricopeptide repeat protein [Chloroflexi bacterium]|nr:tetratricopeptide repeat protein [Chloroflexota bacterium]